MPRRGVAECLSVDAQAVDAHDLTRRVTMAEARADGADGDGIVVERVRL